MSHDDDTSTAAADHLIAPTTDEVDLSSPPSSSAASSNRSRTTRTSAAPTSSSSTSSDGSVRANRVASSNTSSSSATAATRPSVSSSSSSSSSSSRGDDRDMAAVRRSLPPVRPHRRPPRQDHDDGDNLPAGNGFAIEYVLIAIAFVAIVGAVTWFIVQQEEQNNQYRYGTGGSNERRVEDTTFELRVSLETAYRGLPVSVEFPGGRQIKCAVCHGEGGVGSNGIQTCPSCNGAGVQTMRYQVAPGYYQTMRQQCQRCGGKGKYVVHKCPKCDGKGVHRSSVDIDIPIDPGLPEAHVLRLQGRGHQVPGLRSGDVVVRIRTEAHPTFTRYGPDLVTSHTITLREALLGFQFDLRHLDGRILRIDRSQVVTSAATILRCDGAGMPRWNGIVRRANDTSFGVWDTIRSLFRTSQKEFDVNERRTEEDGDVNGRVPAAMMTDTTIVDTPYTNHDAPNDGSSSAVMSPSSYGSLYIKIKVRFPTDRPLSNDDKQKLRQLLSKTDE